MPKLKRPKRPKKRTKVILIPPRERGLIDPELIRRAVIEVRDRRLVEECEAGRTEDRNGS